MSIILKLPYPLSANRYWRSLSIPIERGSKKMRQMMVPTEEAKSYKSHVAWLAVAQGVREPLVGRVHVDVKLYPERPKDFEARIRKMGVAWDNDVRCIDLDNAAKVLIDAMNRVVITDDKWIWRYTAERMEPDGPARVLVTVTEIKMETPQEALAL